jgi:hypothetical protein
MSEEILEITDNFKIDESIGNNVVNIIQPFHGCAVV